MLIVSIGDQPIAANLLTPCDTPCALQRCLEIARAVFADIAVGEEGIKKAHEVKWVACALVCAAL